MVQAGRQVDPVGNSRNPTCRAAELDANSSVKLLLDARLAGQPSGQQLFLPCIQGRGARPFRSGEAAHSLSACFRP